MSSVITNEQSHDTVPDRDGYLINVANARNSVGYGTWIDLNGGSDKVMDDIVALEAAREEAVAVVSSPSRAQ